jgi:hypothetical protein
MTTIPTGPDLEPPQKLNDPDFDLKQHDHLRQDLHDAEVEARAFERYFILAIAALWAWTLKEAPRLGALVGVLSAALGLLGGIRMWGLWQLMAAKGAYVARIERALSRPGLGGWENYFGSLVTNIDPARFKRTKAFFRQIIRGPGLIGYTSGVMWLIVILCSIPFGLLLQCTTKPSPARPDVTVQCVAAPVNTAH